MIISDKERIRKFQFMQHSNVVRFDLSTWVAEEIEELFGLDLFVPRDWSPLTVDATEFGQSLAEFSARVKKVAEVFGNPKKVVSENYYATETSLPDLVAYWEVPLAKFPNSLAFAKASMIVYGGPIRPASEIYPTVRVQVRSMSPIGCKVDPRSQYVEAKKPELHPECKAVLRELEDVGAEVES